MIYTVSKAITISSLALILCGCSSLYTDHSNDYRDVNAIEKALRIPSGSVQSKDVLVIPNENIIADLDSSEAFKTPRAKFIFYPMVDVDISESENALVFTVPANTTQSKNIVVEFLSALYGAGNAVSSQTEDFIVSAPFSLYTPSSLESIWRKVSGLTLSEKIFSFKFTPSNNKTLVTVQYRNEGESEEETDWKSPIENDDVYAIAVRLWGSIGRQLNESSASLSNQDITSDLPVWVNHRGIYGIYLGRNVSSETIDEKLIEAKLFKIEGEDNMLAAVPQEEVARVGDIVDFSIPLKDGKEQKLFNVYRRDLDDVSWDKREYPYLVTQQNAGSFLYIDVSKANNPELTSFYLIQNFVK